MAITDLFSTSFMFSLLIIIVLLGVLYAYFNYKLSEQDHKITSMFGLVRSMADEMSYLRKVNNINGNKEEPINLEYATQLLSNEDKLELISVSDNGKSDDDDSEYSEDDSEYSEDSNINGEHSDDDDENHNDNDNFDNNVTDNYLHTNLKLEELELSNEIKTIHLEENIDLNNNFNNIDLNFTTVTEQDEEELVDPHKINIFEEIQQQGNMNMNMNNIEFGVKQDLRKLSLNKLREIIVEKGLTVDASKLKKNDILKMLDAE